MAIPELVEMAGRIADLERRMSGMLRHGTVEEVDTKKQIVRLKHGNDVDGNPFLSPWIPYAQHAGALKVHTPPSKGQQYTIQAPNGDWQQAVAVPMTWSDQNKSPSEKDDENVLTFGDVTITIKGDQVTIAAPKVLIKSLDVMLGDSGGPRVARVGDLTSDGAVIIEGSSQVTAAG